MLRNLGTGVIVATAAIVRAVIHNGGGQRVEFSYGWAEIVPHPLRYHLMGQRSAAAGITLTTALFGIMIPSSRTTPEAPH